MRVKQLRTSIPRWFDAGYLHAKGIKPEAGAYIRSKLEVTQKKILEQLTIEEERLKKLYPDCRIFVVPKMQKDEELAISLDESATDQEIVERYVSTTHDNNAKYPVGRLVGYLIGQLQTTSQNAGKRGLRFIKLVGRNVLSFPTVEIKYARQGLVLLRGDNRDWPKQSNGAGKTSLLSLLPISLYGQTLKDQRHDQWAREGTRARAMVDLHLRDGDGRRIVVSRARRPHGIWLKIDGKDCSSGIRGTGKEETQGIIERLVGFDMRMLLNSVYIDQTISNGFLFGKQKHRMDLIGKLQNLERFDAALKLVAKDISRNTKSYTEELARTEYLEREIKRLQADIADLGDYVEQEWTKQRALASKNLRRFTELRTALLGAKEVVDQQIVEEDDLRSDCKQLESKRRDVAAELAFANKTLLRYRALREQEVCPECTQPAKDIAGTLIENLKEVVSVKKQDLEKLIASWKVANKKREKLDTRIDAYKEKVLLCTYDIKEQRGLLAQAEQGAAEEDKRNRKIAQRKQSLILQLRMKQRILKASRARRKDLELDTEMLEAAKKAFHRSGIPLYLSASLCPILNKAAEEYAEIFFQGKTRVRFAVINGEFSVKIINPHGSQTEKGQSVGEAAMAGVIASFALREVAPKTNLLILDEPGHGLDSEAAKQFAKGLLELKSRFETIIVTTHSPVIEGILSGETTWTVRKRKKRSRLLT